MNKDKSIKDLKEYNDKIKTQLEYSKARVWSLEKQNERLQQEIQRKDNIINELEAFSKDEIEQCHKRPEDYEKYNLTDYIKGIENAYIVLLLKLKELKENK